MDLGGSVGLAAVGLIDGTGTALAYGTGWSTVKSPPFKESPNPKLELVHCHGLKCVSPKFFMLKP